jgi:hypothetical protein
MRQWIRSHLTYANVISTLALFLVLSGGVVYAANTVGSADVIDNSLQSADLKDNAGVKSADVVNDTTTGGGLAAADLRPSSVGSSEVATDSLGAADLATNSVGSLEVGEDSLQGNDVVEASFDTVPSASSAGTASNADTLDGFDNSDFAHRIGPQGVYVQYAPEIGPPLASDCNESVEQARTVVRLDGTTNFYICTGTGGWVGK